MLPIDEKRIFDKNSNLHDDISNFFALSKNEFKILHPGHIPYLFLGWKDVKISPRNSNSEKYGFFIQIEKISSIFFTVQDKNKWLSKKFLSITRSRINRRR